MVTSASPRKKKTLLGQPNNGLVLLFAANMIMFVIIHMVSVIYQLSDIPMEQFHRQVLNWLVLPASAEAFAARPWTLLTHLFTHFGFWHLVSSMVWLWFFGYLLQDMIGNNKLIPVYLYGAVAGALVFLLTANLVPGSNSADSVMGAGAAVMAIAIAITVIAPDYRFFPMINGGIPLWVITVVYVLIDFSTMGKGNIAIAASHTGAAATGFLFARQLRKGRDWSLWMNRLTDWLNDLFNPEKKSGGQKNRLYYRADRKPFEKTANITQQRLDTILEKIHRHGYDQLTDEEKAFLERASREDL
ncbi:rhomboid family intramembrane serine protease [Sediminibacterium soli]|uniref:rhomboid family intramembrane serine protease n=1 Tax=Sediminibacterium soli TaxID=2698829 RepID=UPI00137A06DC|nr:rhomboid family intramembrane serine protease [Sediminibacterium soli]NCI45100.1 rhomboid family intramembrane serine protease [Sediminibacterium soli]